MEAASQILQCTSTCLVVLVLSAAKPGANQYNTSYMVPLVRWSFSVAQTRTRLSLVSINTFYRFANAFNSYMMSPLLFSKGSADPKLTISLGRLPGYVSSAQAPTKKAPWRTIREVGFCSSVSVALSDDAYEVLWDGVHASMPLPQYAKVTMKLENVLEGDFFNEYIKIGRLLVQGLRRVE